jgi:NhaP-type Na+/H+ or K+/H+ antiporter
LAFVYVGMMIVFNPFLIRKVINFDLKTYWIVIFIALIIRTIALWLIYYLYSNKQFNLEEGLEKHVTYDHKIKAV